MLETGVFTMMLTGTSHLFLLSPLGTCTCTVDDSADSVTVAAVSVTVSFVVAFLLGTATGAVVLHCTVGRQSGSNCRPCPKSPEDQNPPPGPTYETVFPPTQTQRENFELKENLAYGPVQN